MTAQDLFITPIWLILLSVGAYLIRPYVTDENTRKYFMPALWVRFAAAILLGVLYQFYYNGGDTFAFHTHGSAHIFDAFLASPIKGLKLLFANGEYATGTYEYARKIWYYRDENSYFVIKVAAFFDLFTLSTYSATALFFAAFSFSGLWALYQIFYQQYKKLHFHLALAILFVPSVVFWGSGILKDTITLGAIGWLTWFFYKIFIKGEWNIGNSIGALLMLYILYAVKIYIVLSFVPALILWGMTKYFKKIKSIIVKILIVPLISAVAILFLYFMSEAVAKENPKYSLDQIAKTAQITAYDIRYGWGARGGAGAGYDLGVLDGTWQSMINLAPSAINVSLFRPYPWEISNPFMVLAAMEAIAILFLTCFILFKRGFFQSFKFLANQNVIFCLVFALVFAFAVGISTYNFGTLMRYKIPLMPFYLSGLVILYHLKSERKAALFASTEYSSSTF
ncbi:MAG: hypothetical protein ACNS60_10940 [Candidatus Cyclobacteriaceae bacterium M2_1C_046]